jgi:nucleotide-binding universal stress UspA family protein
MQVLLLTDFSANSKKMQDYALNFFGDEVVHFILFHAMKPCKTSACEGLCVNDRENSLDLSFNNLKKQLKPHQTVSKVFVKNNLVDSVRNFIDKSKVHMIVMGGKGKTSDDNKQFGKNTYDIVTKIRCPILVVHKNTSIKIPGNIVFPLDYTTSVQSKYFKTVSQLDFWNKMNLSILEVPNKMVNNLLFQKVNKQKISKAFKEIKLNFKTMSPKEDSSICEKCLDSDMIMFMAKNLTISNQIFSQLDISSSIQKTPLLVLHA